MKNCELGLNEKMRKKKKKKKKKYLLFSRRDVILSYRNLNTFAEGHFLKEPLFVMRRAYCVLRKKLAQYASRNTRYEIAAREEKWLNSQSYLPEHINPGNVLRLISQKL